MPRRSMHQLIPTLWSLDEAETRESRQDDIAERSKGSPVATPSATQTSRSPEAVQPSVVDTLLRGESANLSTKTGGDSRTTTDVGDGGDQENSHEVGNGPDRTDDFGNHARQEASLATNDSVDAVLATTALPLSQTFLLQSNPTASKTIYLDFNGHTTTNTTWNNSTMGSSFYSPPYDTDGNPAAFGDAELTRIQWIWQRVASDFAPFDVNVTTMAPPADWLVNDSGTGADTNYGVRAVVTSYGPSSSTASGMAYWGSFTWSQDCPVFIYKQSTVTTAECVTHEVGHALGLEHDGTTSGVTYYSGNGSGETGWSPVMGSSLNNVSTWDDGSYPNSNNSGSSGNGGRGGDDLAVITGYNGFGYRMDREGDSLTSAAPLSISRGTVAQFGTIQTRLDRDCFSFQLTAAGDLNLSFDPYWFRAYVDDDGQWGGSSTTAVGPIGDPVTSTPYAEGGSNLDLAVELYDGQGNLLASANDPGLAAHLAVQGLNAGSYYLKLDGVGIGDPTASTPTGYSDYASIGNYWISGTISSAADTPSTPMITLALASSSVQEDGMANLVYTFSRSLASTDPLTITFTVSGTATNGSDYSGLLAGSSQTISFAAGATTATLVIDPIADSTVESDETVSLTLAGGAGYSVGTVDAVTGTISNDDVSPSTTTTSLVFTSAVDLLTGTSVADRFVMNRLSDALWSSTPDRITNLQAGTDSIDSPVARNSAITAKQLGALQTLDAAGIGVLLTSKAFPKNGAATFTFGSGSTQRTFLALNDSFSGFNSSSDSVIEITGFSGNLGSLAIF